jgi:enediyne biosynthesis protein E4
VYPEIDRSTVGETYRQKTLLYRNLGNGRFADITNSAGPAFVPARASRGLAVGDLDGDGRPEIVIVNMNERPALLKNVGPQQNAIAVTLRGTRSNRSAIGARCVIQAGGRKQTAEVVGGGSYYSQNSLTLHFGLGTATRVDSIEVRWPSGERQVWPSCAANQAIELVEGKDTATVRPFTRAR